MNNAIIGYTGLVGSHLSEQQDFQELYNTSNIEDIRGKEFDLVVCAGVSAVKWWSNQNPEEDKIRIDSLLDNLKSISAKRFVLISTVDVYANPFKVDELSTIKLDELHAYGLNRRQLETQISELFPCVNIVRLPGLFGKRLKKNVLYDMIFDNMTDSISPGSEFQWYPLDRLWRDISQVIDSDLRVCNFSVEPIATGAIQQRFFPDVVVGDTTLATVKYDMQSCHSSHFGSKTPYIVSANQVMDAMSDWLNEPALNHG